MENKDNEEFKDEVKKLLINSEIQVYDDKSPSLTSIILEEISKIIKQDPVFFQKYNIPTLKNPEERIFDLFYPDSGSTGVEWVINVAKARYKALRYYSIDNPDEEKLNFAINEIKQIFEGPK
jgi:hypothetical protein